MILRSTTPKDARDERELREWLARELGPEDEETLTSFLWAKHGHTHVDIMAGLVRESGGKHAKAYFAPILELARRPKDVQDAILDLERHMLPKIKDANAWVLGHRGDQAAALEKFNEVQFALKEKLVSMYPGRHEATINGAIAIAFSNGRFDSRAVIDMVHPPSPLDYTYAPARGPYEIKQTG